MQASLVIDGDVVHRPKRDREAVVHHRGCGNLLWTPDKVRLRMLPGQVDRVKGYRGYELLEELKEQPLANFNVLQFYLTDRGRIPEEWKRYPAIMFWGTIFEDLGKPERFMCPNDGNYQFVRTLAYGYSGGETHWHESFSWLSYCGFQNCPAAIVAD